MKSTKVELFAQSTDAWIVSLHETWGECLENVNDMLSLYCVKMVVKKLEFGLKLT